MKRELSKDEKIQLGAKVFCAVLCISVVGGTFGYMKAEEIKAQKEIAYQIENNWGREEIEETKNEVLESLLAKPLSDNEKAHIDKYVVEETTQALEKTFENTEKENTATIMVDNSQNIASQKLADVGSTGFDKNGLPYLANGKQYTFNETTGFPNEAPQYGKSGTQVINPNTGIKYTYINDFGKTKWIVDTIAEQNERARMNRDGIMDFNGDTDLRKMNNEEINEIASNIRRSFK